MQGFWKKKEQKNDLIKVDFHVHSIASWDSLSKGEALLRRARKIGLGKLIITDHNTISEAVRLQKMYPDYVIVGEEILTTKAEILAIFVKEEIPKDIEPLEAFKRLRDQGAFISLSHPYAPMRFHWTEEEMEEYMPWLDAIEIANARCLEEMNHLAMKFAAYHNLRGTVGSDAHGVPELGAMGLELPAFQTADELRESIKHSKVFGHESPFWVRKYSRGAVFRKALDRKLGIIIPEDSD